jgi:hypothetical protein
MFSQGEMRKKQALMNETIKELRNSLDKTKEELRQTNEVTRFALL